MNVLLDTNILGRMAEPGHLQHQVAVDAVAALVRRGDFPCLAPQVLYEFWVIATRPVAANGLGLTPAQTDSRLSRLENVYPVLPDSRAIYPKWRRSVASYQIIGKNAHDARLVVAMAVHGVTHLLTFNGADFSRFSGMVWRCKLFLRSDLDEKNRTLRQILLGAFGKKWERGRPGRSGNAGETPALPFFPATLGTKRLAHGQIGLVQRQTTCFAKMALYK